MRRRDFSDAQNYKTLDFESLINALLNLATVYLSYKNTLSYLFKITIVKTSKSKTILVYKENHA